MGARKLVLQNSATFYKRYPNITFDSQNYIRERANSLTQTTPNEPG